MISGSPIFIPEFQNPETAVDYEFVPLLEVLMSPDFVTDVKKVEPEPDLEPTRNRFLTTSSILRRKRAKHKARFGWNIWTWIFRFLMFRNVACNSMKQRARVDPRHFFIFHKIVQKLLNQHVSPVCEENTSQNACSINRNKRETFVSFFYSIFINYSLIAINHVLIPL